MRLRLASVVFLVCLFLCAGSSIAQISSGGKPVSFQKALKSAAPVEHMPPVDVQALLVEDEEEQKLGIPFRFGYPHEVELNLDNSGVWETLDDGSRVWRLSIHCPGAYSINLIYDEYDLPPGATLHLYDREGDMVMGAFTDRNNKDHGKFATSPVKGDLTTLEYRVPAGAVYIGRLSVQRVIHAYKNIFFSRSVLKETLGFGSSGDCNINVHCPEGDGWEDQIRSVAMITTAGGWRLCSGALINNVREDLTPYFLTANHCLGGEDTWVIMFNYESPTCEDIDGPTWMTVSGTTLLSTNTYSDFALLELSEQPPDSYNVFYAGWSAVNTPAASAVGIHHPSGDIKKISFDFDPVTATSYLSTGGDDSHWRVGEWELGTTEGGSSGSPLFDPDHRIVGQLHGGYASCKKIQADWYGNFAKSWDYGSTPTTRLMDWLDPDNIGVLILDGTDPRGVNFEADVTAGQAPLEVNFTGSSLEPVDSWSWDFGDGNFGSGQTTSNTYLSPGLYDVRLDVDIGGEMFSKTKYNYIAALADSILGEDAFGEPEMSVEVGVYARNFFPLEYIRVPVEYGGDLPLVFDSFSTVGCRTAYFDTQDFLNYDPFNKRLTLRLRTDTDGSQPELEPGAGEIMRLYFTIESSAVLDQTTAILFDGYNTYTPSFQGSVVDYTPYAGSGSITYREGGCCVISGDFNHDGRLDALDITDFVNWLFKGGASAPCANEVDVDGDGRADALDLTYLVEYMWKGGPAPVDCF